MSAIDSTALSFIENAPPGELKEVIDDIQSLLELDRGSVQQKVAPAVEKYNKAQYVTTKLPGGSGLVIVSSYNDLGGGRFFDTESSSSFAYDHTTQRASDVQSHPIEGDNASTVKSLVRDVGDHVKEHFPSLPAHGVYPTDDGIAILIVGNKYSPSNYWNGRWRSTYVYNPSTSSLTGTIAVDVHYYEDGNVRLVTEKKVNESLRSGTSSEIVKAIANVERKYQEELNRAFGALSEGAFKSLRRSLPVTRQKMDWQKAGAYKIGQDIGGGGRAR
ncbi:F-actin-capping protein subunit alpha [Orbilia ellipsospora]|uniref:F-actin-capping protein subunit alpha n=1 Tax=Orbilia ellipsospora TaxID=2528407 RepID=A0AAV9XGA9_9PEZI